MAGEAKGARGPRRFDGRRNPRRFDAEVLGSVL